MGFVFQSFNLVPTLTALENVALAAEYAGMGGSADAPRRHWRRSHGWRSTIARGIDPWSSRAASEQRVALARALVNSPTLLLADEPTGNLDSARSAQVLALLRRHNRERGQTTVLVTHDPLVAAAAESHHPHA